MGEIRIGDKDVSDMRDDELLAWMQEIKSGYRLREETARIWIAVLRSFDQQGTPMTVRGLFYNLENVFHVVPKSENGYNRVAKQVLAMRRTGVLPYGFVADNTRWVRKPTTYTGLQAYFEHGRRAYRRALWDNQKDYVEVWCEKDAIAGILQDITSEWDVPLMVIRGYSSETFAYEAAENIKSKDKVAHAYYFGDWDRYGVNISSDIERKLLNFNANVVFDRVTVTPWQIYEWNLPTRPAKDDDWGPCVEVDAVPANKLRQLAEECIKRHIDQESYRAAIEAEELERKTLEDIMNNWGLASNSSR